jgi:hypothetical protein
MTMMIRPKPRMILSIEMAMIDQKERYRQRAALCYEIAATLSGDTARSMKRLGDSYSGLAGGSDNSRTGIFVPTKRHERPHCVTCGKEMRKRRPARFNWLVGTLNVAVLSADQFEAPEPRRRALSGNAELVVRVLVRLSRALYNCGELTVRKAFGRFALGKQTLNVRPQRASLRKIINRINQRFELITRVFITAEARQSTQQRDFRIQFG